MSKLNVSVKMEKRVFVWLAQERLRTEFIDWARANGRGRYSYSTLSRAMERQYTREELTHRQRAAEQAAIDFRNTVQETSAVAA